MLGYISKFLLGVLTSLYFFPFEFTFLPGYNTKKLMAAFSLVLWGYNLAKRRYFTTDKHLFTVSVFAIIVSLAGVFSAIINNTPDYTYASYIMSMWVWLGASYVVVNAIKAYHKTVSVDLVCHYLIGVCVVQCFLALIIDNNPLVKDLVDTYVGGSGFVDQAELAEKNRLYGIGCSLDVAGTRFSAVLVMIAAMLSKHKDKGDRRIYLYLFSFAIVGVVGNMIARTTTLGVILALLYWICKALPFDMNVGKTAFAVFRKAVLMVAVLLPFIIYQYNHNYNVRENIRFAFEGFFSLVEEGEWSVSSNDILKKMYVFPDNAKTWIIGDGYFDGPTGKDPYYVGPDHMSGFYMWTDVGYCRFIFYFGLVGLIAFMLFFLKVADVCVSKFPRDALMFWLILGVNYAVWMKVATDIFLVFALFLSIDKEDNDEYEEMMAEESAAIEG